MKQIVYIANSESQTIEVWKLYPDGKMEIIQTVHVDGNVQPINFIKSKNLLYVGVRPKNRILIYTIKKNGTLFKQGEKNIPGSSNYISFSPDKKFLFCSSYHHNSMSVIPLSQNGNPKNPIQIIHNINGCHSALFNTKYNVLFITSLKEDTIYLYYLTKYGILKNTQQKYIQTKYNSGPRHIVFHPNQDFLYNINELNGTIDAWKIYIKEKIVQVKHIQNISIVKNHIITNKYWSSDIQITSNGNFLYVSDRILNNITLFNINKKNGKIILIKHYPTEIQPRTFCIDKYNKYILVAGQKSNKFTIYKIDINTGNLEKLNRYSTGKEPLWIITYPI
ncbi:6-phosphogluconolactonase [Buchnera aphidicola (Protaphis terricola)]|uniref:6-phosphogluconolactonase n=1 Tax=Buchnera aphidicola TaxID=9 RepID=UPI003463ECB9